MSSVLSQNTRSRWVRHRATQLRLERVESKKHNCGWRMIDASELLAHRVTATPVFSKKPPGRVPSLSAAALTILPRLTMVTVVVITGKTQHRHTEEIHHP